MRSLRLALPSLNGLFTFEAAARCGTFGRAATELNVTPAAVSRMIARLEEHVGAPLFERLPGGIVLTEEGRILYDALSRSFSGIETALREIEDRRTGLETVTLSVSTGFTTHWIMPNLAAFKQAFPGVELRFQLITKALGGPVNDVDLGMRFVDGADDRHEATYIMPELLLPICSPGYSDGGSISDARGKAATVINLSEAQPDWSDLFFPGAGAASPSSLIFSDYAVVVQAALLGQGVALGWLNVAAHWLRTGALVPVGNRIMVTGRHCQFLRTRERRDRPIVRAVRDWIIGRLREDLTEIDRLYPDLGLAERL